MKDLADYHFQRLDGQETRALRAAVDALETAGVRYALAGGWAVYAYHPRIPSADVDVFVMDDVPDRVSTALQDQGFGVGEGRQIEFLEANQRIELWGIGDLDMGIPDPAYDARRLLENEVTRVPIPMGKVAIRPQVASPASLAAMKLVAFHNRNLAFRGQTDASAQMRLGRTLMPLILARNPGYWLAKAGKDLFDLSLLSEEAAARQRAVELLAEQNLAEFVPDLVKDIHPTVAQMARDLARRVRAPNPVQAVIGFFGSSVT